MLSTIQSDVAVHDLRLEQLESRLNLLETDFEEMQEHLQAALQENKRLGDKVEYLENRLRRNNLYILGVPDSVPQRELVAICERELPAALGLPGILKVERAAY